MLIECADYDSIGNHGRFPKPKNIKYSFIRQVINSFNKLFYVKRG